MNDSLPQVTFDETLAKEYQPIRVVKRAVLVPVPEGVKTTIFAEWGEEQNFVGPWYGIYNDEGQIKYGSGKQEFDETHGVAEEVENGFYKNTPIKAYQYHGPDARVVTILGSGVVETENTVTDGAWMAQWPHGEVGVIKEPKFPTLYKVD